MENNPTQISSPAAAPTLTTAAQANTTPLIPAQPVAGEKLIETQTRAHHPYSPSSLQSIEACPLFRSRQNVKEHARTTAGTRAHNSADTETDDERLSDEDAAAVAECLDYVAKLKDDFILVAKTKRLELEAVKCEGGTRVQFSPQDFEGKVLEINEPYLPIDDLIFPDCTSTTAGYADKLIFSWDCKHVHVADYKFGLWPVTEAATNLQGLAYALGVFKKWKTVEQVTIHFLQPLLGKITVATIYRKDIPEHYFRICAVVAKARVAREQLARELAAGQTPTYEQAQCWAPVCSFCDHLGKCTKALGVAIKVGQKFYPLDIPENITPTAVLDPHNTELAMRLSMTVAAWAKAFRTTITDRVLRGDADVPAGFKIVSQSKRELVDMEGYRKLAIKIIGAKAFAETLQTTFGAVEDLIAEKAPRGLKKKVVEQFQKETEESGAVKRGLPVSFLKAIPKADKE